MSPTLEFSPPVERKSTEHKYEGWELDQARREGRAQGYRAGQESMRERAALKCTKEIKHAIGALHIPDAIRALPIEEFPK